jgi:hypothetical protein
MIFDLHQIAISRLLGYAQDRTVINPRVAGHDSISLAGLE